MDPKLVSIVLLYCLLWFNNDGYLSKEKRSLNSSKAELFVRKDKKIFVCFEDILRYDLGLVLNFDLQCFSLSL